MTMSMKSSVQSFLSIFIVSFLLGCVSTKETPSTSSESLNSHELDIQKFSELSAKEKDFKGWHFWKMTPNKKITKYYLQKHQGKTVLRADALSSASGLIVPLRPKSVEELKIAWSWKSLNHIASANNADTLNDDAPLRLMLAFDGDKTKLSFKDQMAFEMAELISGHEMPYATLMYVWGGNAPLESVVINGHSTRVRMIVVDSNQSPVDEWRHHSRVIQDDFKKAFNEVPGKLIGVGVMTDSDNTKSEAHAFYGDIELISNKKAIQINHLNQVKDLSNQ